MQDKMKLQMNQIKHHYINLSQYQQNANMQKF